MLLFYRLNMSNRSRLSAGGVDATAKLKKKKAKVHGFSVMMLHNTKNCANQYLSLSVITRASVMQVLAIAVCIMKNTKDRA